ncbi:DNA glycosylase [Lipomyces japonicus]|uniref:DNA glycosylase n=1 Tax=Lipomyces japonicus TaxID=56871 RepID=UPI0034CE2DDF
MTAKEAWKRLDISIKEICLDTVLPSGQSFKWKRLDSEWISVLGDSVVILKQSPEHIHFRALPEANTALVGPVLLDYFNHSISLTNLHRKFAARDAHFRAIAADFSGIRMLRQDPWETLVSFICSANNNIKRIETMIANLARTFGTFVASYGDTDFFTFPPPAALTDPAVVRQLRDLGFGYRAPYIHATAVQAQAWLELGNQFSQLRGQPYPDVREFLLRFQGVGPKVADCVCLMAFDCHDAVPIDTHMWNIIQRRYAFKSKIRNSSKAKTLSKAMYDEIGDYLRSLWGNYAGWAQAVIFISELRK